MDADAEALIRSLQEKKERLNQQANRHRDFRDKMNEQTKAHAARRDELNGKVREIIDRANQHKQRRDELNVQVRQAKAKRDELNLAANEKADALNAIKKTRTPLDGASLGKLKHQLHQLEFEQQTKVMTPKKEKALIDQIAALEKDLKEKEKSFEADDTIKAAYEAMKIAKTAAEEQHKAVTELANAAQEQHDSMVRLFEEADKYRNDADAAQDLFVKSKLEADKVHHEYIEMVNQIRDIDKVGSRMRSPGRMARGPESARAEARAEAEDIFDKFRKGEKLSTEDLMALQKAGLL